jgi:signal transduction histidine kinase
MWEKIALNLVSNACKFTFEGTISVALHAVDGGGAVELRVRDTGIGVPSAELPRLFERFHRVEGARACTHEGSGIGLALVQQLAHLHDGTIRAESVEGEGSTFWFTLPVARVPAQRA